jgi:hypothetical protein
VKGSVFHDLIAPDAPWAGMLDTLTPVDQGASGVLYKREDQFAPLGYGGINGSKLRQLIHLVDNVDGPGGARGIITAASVHSPQISMAALVGRHYGLPVTVVLGATKPSTSVRHENVRIAQRAGAHFIYTPVGYNPALQAACDRLAALPHHRGWYRLHYGITTPPSDEPWEVHAFHSVGARQAVNIPPQVRTIVITAGSCNSVTSLLLGIARYGAGALSRVVLVGIGPNRVQWLARRLAVIEGHTGLEIRKLFTWRLDGGSLPELAGCSGPVLLEHHDLHSAGWVRYADRRPWRQDGIDFHPTYEGKAMTWLDETKPFWWERAADGTVLFWIVGSEPKESAMEDYLP